MLSYKKHGKLKIFLGYAVGVGKTYAMLQSACRAKEQGCDVVAGYIDPQSDPQTLELVRALEQIPLKYVLCKEKVCQEFDLDAVLQRSPQLVLVDEFAHTNAEGSRHVKRYQDIKELLNAGIDVYTTLNIQNIESLKDTIASIVRVPVLERIPDSIFDHADQVELIDLEPEELLERLNQKRDHEPEENRQKTTDLFTIEDLTALREIALRRCADRVSLFTQNARNQNHTEYQTEEHILVCLSSSPSNQKIIRTAARMARAFKGSFTALFVETPSTAQMSEENKKRLHENIRLAEQLGADVENSYGEDVPYQIAEFARLSGVSKIVIGRSTVTKKGIWNKPTLTERLIDVAPNLDIYVIPDIAGEDAYRRARIKLSKTIPVRDIVKSILVLWSSTLIGYAFYTLGITEANIIAVYIFGVLVTSIVTTSRLCGLFSSIISVLVFNFFFTIPRYTFHFNDPDYLVTFSIMFMVAFLTDSLTAKLKENAKQSARAAFRTKILFETNQLIQKEKEETGILNAAAGQIMKLLDQDLVMYPLNEKVLGEPILYRTKNSIQEDLLSDKEREVAKWVLQNNKHAGATTDTFSSAKCMYLAIRVGQHVYGVVGIAMGKSALDPFENSVFLSILGECALALQSIKNAKEKEEAAILAKNEQLRANLLRAISHDLRTPLTSICGSADNLLVNYQKMDDESRIQTFTDIYEDSMWLINLVENLLAVTRIEEGKVNLTLSIELMDEVISEALRHISRKSKTHRICVKNSEDLILAHIDARLIVQVLINLIDNAIKYTQADSCIEISTQKEENWVKVTVTDDGPGIPDEQKKHIFEMFYSGANKIADSRRSLGLGLSLCKSIITAHGGVIQVSDNQPKGTIFTFTVPVGKVELHDRVF